MKKTKIIYSAAFTSLTAAWLLSAPLAMAQNTIAVSPNAPVKTNTKTNQTTEVTASEPQQPVEEMPLTQTHINAPEAVEGGELKTVGLWGYYENVEGYKNLPSNLWQNSDVSALGAIFAKISEDQKFTPLQYLTRRVILSGGISPSGNKPAYNDDIVATQRFKLAAKLGPLQAASLLNNYPNLSANQDLLIIAADSWFYQNRSEDACNVVEATKPSAPQKDLLELRATCYALNNEPDAAQLSLDLSVGGHDEKPSDSFVWLSRAVAALGAGQSGADAKITFRADNGRTYALSRRLGLLPTASQVPKLSAMTLSALTTQATDLKSDIYLNAAIKGAISPEEYSHFANDVTGITPLEPFKKNTTDANGNPIVVDVERPPLKGENFAHELADAKDIQAFAVIAKRLAPKFAEIDSFDPQYADIFAKAAIIASDKTAALRFAKVSTSLDASSRLALGILTDKKDAIPERIKSGNDNGKNEGSYYGEIAIASALGLKGISSALLINGDFSISPYKYENLLTAMDIAADRKAMAETALLSGLVLQGQEPKTIDALTVARVVANLNKVGLRDDAKELAIFTIMAQSFDFNHKPVKPVPPKAEVTKTEKVAAKPSAPKVTEKSKPVTKTDTSKAVAKNPAKETANVKNAAAKVKTAATTKTSKTNAAKNVPSWGNSVD